MNQKCKRLEKRFSLKHFPRNDQGDIEGNTTCAELKPSATTSQSKWTESAFASTAKRTLGAHLDSINSLFNLLDFLQTQDGAIFCLTEIQGLSSDCLRGADQIAVKFLFRQFPILLVMSKVFEWLVSKQRIVLIEEAALLRPRM